MTDHSMKLAPAPMREWCRIVVVDGVSVLFFEEFLHDEKQHRINAIVRTDGAVCTIEVRSRKPFTQQEFDDFATKHFARMAILQAARFGLTPLANPEYREDEPC
jgi:hypothetical protein